MKKKIFIKNYVLSLILLTFVGCKTYYIPVESFKEQFKGANSLTMRNVKTQGPYGEIYEYKANPIDYIKCVDKNKIETKLKISPSIEIRFTEKNNNKTIFYFDRIYLDNGIINGDRSRFIGLNKSISLSDIILIEIQDGKKNFKYISK